MGHNPADIDNYLHFLFQAGRLLDALANNREVILNRHKDRDALGRRVPFMAREAFENMPLVQRHIDDVLQAVQNLLGLCGMPGTEQINTRKLAEMFSQLPRAIFPNLPFSSCPKCADERITQHNCICGGKRWLSYSQAEQAVKDGHVPMGTAEMLAILTEQAELWVGQNKSRDEQLQQSIDAPTLKPTCRIPDARPA